MTIIFLVCEKKPSDSFSMMSKIKNCCTFDLDDVFRAKFLLNLQKLIKFFLILIIRRYLDLFRKEKVFCFFVFKNAASAQKFIVVIRVKVVLTKYGLLLIILSIRLIERVEFFSANFLSWKLIGICLYLLGTTISHVNIIWFTNKILLVNTCYIILSLQIKISIILFLLYPKLT